MSLSTPILTVRSSACAALVSAAAAAKANVAISLMTNLPDCGLEAHISCSFYSKLQDRRAAAASWSLVTRPLPLVGRRRGGGREARRVRRRYTLPSRPPTLPSPNKLALGRAQARPGWGEGLDERLCRARGHHEFFLPARRLASGRDGRDGRGARSCRHRHRRPQQLRRRGARL